MSDTLRDLLRFTDEQKQELRRRMMTDTLRDRIAVVLESEGLTQLGALSVANVVIRELSLRSGIAVVELPEPDYEDSTGHGPELRKIAH